MQFWEKVSQKLILAAKDFYKLTFFVFVINSNYFKFQKSYSIRFHKDNFLHLTGVITKLKANVFFDKCFRGEICKDDFDCDSTKELKGKVREKLKNLENISSFFDGPIQVEEMFEKNRIKCKIAVSEGRCTLGFVETTKILVPLTLLNRNLIQKEKCIYCTVAKFKK